MTGGNEEPGVGDPLWVSATYRRWFVADTAGAFGVALRSTAVSLVAFAVTRSTTMAGTLGTMTQVVQQGFMLIGGTFVDRHDRRLLMMVNAGIGAAMWLLVGVLIGVGRLSTVELVVVACLMGAVNGLLGKASDAMLRSVVPTGRYPHARSLNEGRDAGVSLVGGPLSGLLYGVSAWMPFLAMSACDAVGAFAAARLRSQPAGRSGAHRQVRTAGGDGFLHEYVEGWRWVCRRRRLLLFSAVACLMNFGANGMVYAVQLHLIGSGAAPWRIGVVGAGSGAAMLIGALAASRLSDRLSVSASMIVTLVCYATCMAPMVLTDRYAVVLICSSLAFVPLPLFNAMVMGFILAKTPDRLQGRVSVAVAFPAQSLSMFTGALAGLLVETTGFSRTIFVFLTVVAVALTVVLASPSLRGVPCAARWEETSL